MKISSKKLHTKKKSENFCQRVYVFKGLKFRHPIGTSPYLFCYLKHHHNILIHDMPFHQVYVRCCNGMPDICNLPWKYVWIISTHIFLYELSEHVAFGDDSERKNVYQPMLSGDITLIMLNSGYITNMIISQRKLWQIIARYIIYSKHCTCRRSEQLGAKIYRWFSARLEYLHG